MSGETPCAPVFEHRFEHLRRRGHAGTGLRRSGAHDRRADTRTLEFHPHLADERFEAGLGGVVGTHPGPGKHGTVGSDHDEVAALAFDHAGEHAMGQALGAHQVHVDLEGEPVGVHLVGQREIHVARSRDDDLRGAESLFRCGDELVDGFGGRHVEEVGEGLAALTADLLRDRRALLHAARPERDGVPGLGERVGGGGTDSGGGSGDQRGTAFGMGFESRHVVR